MGDLLIITPTRGRPANVQRLISTIGATSSTQPDLILAIDDDDLSYDHIGPFPSWVSVVRGTQRSCAEWTTEIAVDRAGSYRAVASFSDDHVPVTPHWDRLLLDALDGRTGVAYGNDLLRGELVPTAAIVSASIVTALGYMTPPGVDHLYIDCFWYVLGEALGNLKYCPDVIIEHYHPSAGKAAWDDGYARVNSPDQYVRDKAAYDRFLTGRWPGDLDKLRKKLAVVQ